MYKVFQQKGFTWIELVIVLSILGIIAAVIVINIPQFFQQHQQSSDNTTIDTIITGQLSSIQIEGDYSFLYFTDGPRIVVTTKSLQDQIVVLNCTSPYIDRWTYYLKRAGEYYTDYIYDVALIEEGCNP